MGNAYAIWLMPAEPLKSKIRTTIQSLATEFQAPEIEPHMTLYRGAMSRDEVTAVAAKLAASFKPIEIESQGLGCGKTPLEALYIKFHLSTAVKKFLEAVKAGAPEAANFSPNPHIALLYKQMPIEKSRELCQRAIVRSGIYTFDFLRVMEIELPITDASTADWAFVTEYRLGDS